MKLDYTWQQTVILGIVVLVVGGLVYTKNMGGDALVTLLVGLFMAPPVRSTKTEPKVLTPSQRPPPPVQS